MSIGTDRYEEPRFDLPAYSGPLHPYLICSTPRSGSTVLCDAMTRSRLLGVPTEYLNPGTAKQMAARFGVIDPDGELRLGGYLRALLRHRTSPNGRFGMKCHFNQLKPLLRTPAIATLLGRCQFIRIGRADRLAQAISYVLARETGIWASREGDEKPTPAVSYARGLVQSALMHIAEVEAEWDLFFSANAIRPLVLSYEDIVDRPEASAARLGAFLGVPDRAIDLRATDLRRSQTQEKNDWRRRVMEEYRLAHAAEPRPLQTSS